MPSLGRGKAAESAVLSALRQAHRELTLISIIDVLRREGSYSESDIKAAIWRLIEEDKISMSSTRSLHVRP
jgi:hypothetical protein